MALAFVPAGAAQGHPVIQGDVIADLCGFTDHHPHAVVDKEPTTNLGTRVDFNTGQPAGKRGNNARQLLEVAPPQAMGQTVKQHRMQAGIVEQHFQRVAGRRVPMKYRRNVLAYSIKHSYLVQDLSPYGCANPVCVTGCRPPSFFSPAPPAHPAKCSFPFCRVGRA